MCDSQGKQECGGTDWLLRVFVFQARPKGYLAMFWSAV